MGGEFVTAVSPECRNFLLEAFSGREELFDAFLEKMKLLQGILYEKIGRASCRERVLW